MKKGIGYKVLEKVNNVALCTLKVSANSTCFYLAHQPELPKNLDKFKKKSE